jgi:protein involved in polysaccharide export with SLBB domain
VAVPTRYYFIQGEIRAPGRYQIMSATRVSQAIAGGGGYTEFASGQVLIRRGGKVFKTIRNARRLERSPQDDIQLEPDDIIEVKRSLW